MIAVVDLKISNLASVLNALRLLDAPDHDFATPASVASASAVILPGVGAFGDGMASLRDQGLIAPLKAAAAAGKPIFGICLGMQLLATRSTEFGSHEGLDLVAGQVERLVATDPGYRVPNIGWCDVRSTGEGVLFPRQSGGCFYHVHSFHLVTTRPGVRAASMEYSGREVTVAVEDGNLFGVQFHAEKSQDDGLHVLSRFLAHVRARSGAAP